ncbi:HET-domain-containing protein, partial [Echria macrotheca]
AAVNHNRRYEHMPAAMVPHWYIRLWSVIPEPSSERAKDALCTNCRHIDIRALFRQPATTVMPLARDFIALGRLESILQEGIAGCKLCALALRVILIDATSDLPPSTTADERLAKKREKLNALLKETYYVCPIKFKAQPPAPILYLCSRSDVAEMVAKRTRPRYTMGFRPMHQSCPSHGRALRNPGTIDFEWIRKTLRMCDERDVGKLDYRHAVPVRAIDVDAMCIADVADGQRYVTLSYVWGANVQQLRLTKSAEQTFRQPGGLQDFLGQIPQTIQDAIALTRAIGERYLWVDVLCIVQDDDADLQHSIGEMGSIYRNSILTICACCGDDASYGLPGVRPGTRTATDQTCSAVGQCLGLSNVIGDSADAAEEGCTWATRGWTMQEKVLSQRKLEITDRSVRWWCWHAVASEDENCQHPHWDIGEEHRTMYFFKTEHEQVVSKITGKKCNMDTYAFMVADYTGRSLTHHGDAEMAFRGVLKQIQYSFRGTFLAGLPDTELSAALLWVPLGKQQRRRDATTGRDLFPSWSWLGWSGKASYPWLVERSMPMSEAGCPLEWRRQTWRQGDHDEWFTGLEYRLNGSSDPNWREKTRGKPPRWRIHESDGWCSTEDDEEGSGWLHPVEVAFPSSSTRANQYTGHATNARDIRTLRLRTLSACFHLEGTFRRRKDNHDHLHAVYQMRVLDPKGFSVGYIYTPDPSTMTVEGQSQFGGGGPREFIALSRASTNPDPRFGRDLLYTTPISELSSVYSTWDPGNDSSAGHENSEDVDDIAHFNTRLFDPELPWGLFNVMMISREGEVAKRVAIGRIHVAAFMGGLPLLKEITLE